MKKLMCLVLVLAFSSMVWASYLPEPGAIETEDFEGCLDGVDIMTDGWEPQWNPGSGALANMLGASGSVGGEPVGMRAVHSTGSGAALGKPGELPNTLTTADTQVYFKMQMRTYGAYSFASMAVYQAPPQPPNTNAGYYNGPGIGCNGNFTLMYSDLNNEVVGTPDLLGIDNYDWEMGINMTIDYADPSLSVGTVVYRPWGSTADWSIDPLLVDIPLGMHYGFAGTYGDQPENLPVNWSGFFIREGYGNQYDNLEYGTGHLIPEPCTIALLGLGGLLLRKRR